MNQNGIPSKPYLKPWYRIAQEERRLILEYAQTVVVFEGEAVRRLLPALLPLLDGSRSVPHIVATLGEPIEAAVLNALGKLSDSGLLTEGPRLTEETPEPIVQTAHFLTSAAFDAPPVAETRAALEEARVRVNGTGPAAEEIARLLRRSGIADVEQITDATAASQDIDLVVVAPTSHDLPGLDEWNRGALREELPWLQVLPFDGKFAAIGPLYLPGETCCYHCFRLRRISNLDYPDEFRALASIPATYPEPPSLVAAVAGLASMMALRWIANRDRALPGAFYALEHGSSAALTFHRVYRVPRCPVCSDVAEVAQPLPWYKEVRVADG